MIQFRPRLRLSNLRLGCGGEGSSFRAYDGISRGVELSWELGFPTPGDKKMVQHWGTVWLLHFTLPQGVDRRGLVILISLSRLVVNGLSCSDTFRLFRYFGIDRLDYRGVETG